MELYEICETTEVTSIMSDHIEQVNQVASRAGAWIETETKRVKAAYKNIRY